MPRKVRKTQQSRVSKPAVRKTDRREHTIEKRVAGTCLVEMAHSSLRSAAKKVGIPPSTLAKIRQKAVKHATDNDLPLTDPSNYKDDPRPGRPHVMSEMEADQLCSRVVSTRESQNKSAEQHIREMDLNISVSAFAQIMYDRGYERRSCAWEIQLDPRGKKEKAAIRS